ENKLRAGTLNVPGIVGLGKAAEIAGETQEADASRLARLRDKLEQALITLPETGINGIGVPRLPHVSNMTFRHVKAAEIMVHARDIAVASGSACVSGPRDPSHVLLAMGLAEADAHASLRFSLGRFNSEEDIDNCIQEIRTAVETLRANSPVWQLYRSGA